MPNSIFEKYYDPNKDIWGYPQNFKDIDFYPLKTDEQIEFGNLYMLLTFCQEQIQDKIIARMSYLKFVVCILSKVYKMNMAIALIEFLKFITKREDIKLLDSQSKEEKMVISNFLSIMSGQEIDEDESHYEFYTLDQLNKLKFYIAIGDVKFTEQDFEIIREIILKQHGLDLDYIRQYDPSLEEKLKILYKGDPATFEERVFALSAVMKLPIYDIKNNYTIYQFNKTIERLQIVEDYQAFKGLESAGFIQLKKGEISHWLSHVPKKGRYDDLLVSKEEFISNNEIFKTSLPKKN